MVLIDSIKKTKINDKNELHTNEINASKMDIDNKSNLIKKHKWLIIFFITGILVNNILLLFSYRGLNALNRASTNEYKRGLSEASANHPYQGKWAIGYYHQGDTVKNPFIDSIILSYDINTGVYSGYSKLTCVDRDNIQGNVLALHFENMFYTKDRGSRRLNLMLSFFGRVDTLNSNVTQADYPGDPGFTKNEIDFYFRDKSRVVLHR
ncbi:MAG: hypothetical protein V4553_16250 [Bacteroidota bacterium]